MCDAQENPEVGPDLFPLSPLTVCVSNCLSVQLSVCRLYEQLEEVKQLKAVRTKQEDYAKNRLKAKEFHKVSIYLLKNILQPSNC